MAEYWFPQSQDYREKMKNPPETLWSLRHGHHPCSTNSAFVKAAPLPVSDGGSTAIVEGWAGPWKPQSAERWDYSLKSQWARSLFPNLLSREVLPVTAVCHQAGQPGIAPIRLGSSWQYRWLFVLLPTSSSPCYPTLQLGKARQENGLSLFCKETMHKSDSKQWFSVIRDSHRVDSRAACSFTSIFPTPSEKHMLSWWMQSSWW